MLEAARAAMPELPAARAERLERELGLSAERAHQLAFRGELGDFFERALAADGAESPVALANWVGGELVARVGEADPADSRVEPGGARGAGGDGRAKRASSRDGGARGARRAGRSRAATPRRSSPSAASARSTTTPALARDRARAIAADPAAAEQVRAGNAKAIGALVGPIMRETTGRADGAEVTRLIREALGSSVESSGGATVVARAAAARSMPLGSWPAANDASGPLRDHLRP